MCFEIRDIQCMYLCACVCMCMSMCMCVRLVKGEGGIYLFRDFGAVNTGVLATGMQWTVNISMCV